jgi:hypothetical protein
MWMAARAPRAAANLSLPSERTRERSSQDHAGEPGFSLGRAGFQGETGAEGAVVGMG